MSLLKQRVSPSRLMSKGLPPTAAMAATGFEAVEMLTVAGVEVVSTG